MIQVSLLKDITLKVGPFEIGAVKADKVFVANRRVTKMSCITPKGLGYYGISLQQLHHVFRTYTKMGEKLEKNAKNLKLKYL